MMYRKSSAWPIPVSILLLTLVFCGSLAAQSVDVQNPGRSQPAYREFVRQMRTAPATKTICYKTERDMFSRTAPPDAFLKRRLPNGRPAAPTAEFIVSYSNFTPDAQRAFQYAVDIWSSLIVSSVPIRIQANWTRQDPGVLGSAGPTDYRLGSDGAQKAEGFYPIALAEKIARRQLNGPNDPDITADFNRNNNWYYGTDGKTPAGQTDLVSVVLHEIAHGLGFIGFFDVTANRGQYSAGLPAVYDHFIETGFNERFVVAESKYPDNSAALYQQLTSNSLYLNGQILRQRTGQRARLYAPTVFDLGSSVYHFDENIYVAGDINSLMTPQLGNAEAIHTPGPLVLNFFTDMEWKTTSVLHDPLVSSEDLKDLVFSARVISDTTLTAGSVRLFYRRGAPTATDTTFTAVTPTRVGTTDEYTYTLPAAQAQGNIRYYFQAQDASGRTFTNPGRLRAGAQTYYSIEAGPDVVPPTIRYSPPKNFIFTTAVADSLPFYARISDNRATSIDTAYVEYQLNGVAQPNLPLRPTRLTIGQTVYDSTYVNRLNFPANSLRAGDRISYRIIARDSSRARNQATSPATGFYTLTVVAPQATRDRYANTFREATAAADFVGYGFSLATPYGFGDQAIHSEHPYRNGSSFQYQSDYEYVLLSPIRLMANPDSAQMRFDEIVLVEPNDDGSRFGGEGFYDYVIVEGSADNGRTWRPFLDGYNSTAQPDWLAAYNQNTTTGQPQERISTTAGTPTLFKRREISLIGSGFQAGQDVLIRFRLFADQLAHGWGWAIDNLRIQLPPPPLATEPVSAGRFAVYPNPVSTGLVRIEAELARPVAEIDLTVTGPTGQTLRQLKIPVRGTQLSQQVDLGQLPSGLYFIKLSVGDAVLTRKVVVAQ